MSAPFAERLRALRITRIGSQEALARAAGVSRGAVQGWEAGRRTPRLDVAISVADALGVTLDELAGRGDGPPAPSQPPPAPEETVLAALRAAGEPVREAVLYERVLSRGAEVEAEEFLGLLERLSMEGHLRVSVAHDDRPAHDPEPFEPRMWRVVR